MSPDVRRVIVAAAATALAVGGLALVGCGPASQPKAPCAASIVALYTAEMIAAGCKGEHFNDSHCAPIKERRDMREREAGCK